MYNYEHQSNKINFDYILQKTKNRYVPFIKKVEKNRKPKSIIKAIEKARKEGRNPVIAEVKYRSPTKQSRINKSPEQIAREMISAGACAISVLTEPEFFGGNLNYLKAVKEISTVPVLRKDFIFHATQIPESYYWGADSILLISSFFSQRELRDMIERSRDFNIEPLVEIHSPADIKRSEEAGARLYAINNRDKDTLKIDLKRTKTMAPSINGIKVSASGISSKSDLKSVLKYSDAALIGGAIMNSENIRSKVEELVGK
jgi:indole-3-glycerol phosphate synthase